MPAYARSRKGMNLALRAVKRHVPSRSGPKACARLIRTGPPSKKGGYRAALSREK